MRPPYEYFRTPLYFEFSSSLLRPGVNKIEVHLVSVRYAAFMEPFYLGPAQSIQPAYAYANFLQVTLVRAAIVALLLISAADARPVLGAPCGHGLWLVLPPPRFCWAAYNWLLLEPRMLIPPAGLWFSLPPIALGWFSICSALFINRLPGCGGRAAADGARIPRLRRDRLAGHRGAPPHDARELVDPGLCLVAGHHAHQRVHRMASAACRAPHIRRSR